MGKGAWKKDKRKSLNSQLIVTKPAHQLHHHFDTERTFSYSNQAEF
jgi:hypothetical protein